MILPYKRMFLDGRLMLVTEIIQDTTIVCDDGKIRYGTVLQCCGHPPCMRGELSDTGFAALDGQQVYVGDVRRCSFKAILVGLLDDIIREEDAYDG